MQLTIFAENERCAYTHAVSVSREETHDKNGNCVLDKQMLRQTINMSIYKQLVSDAMQVIDVLDLDDGTS